MQIGLSAWIIQDGNYPDFQAGQRARFALEFYAHAITPSPVPDRSCSSTHAARYDLAGIVTFHTTEVWVVDFGLLAYSESQPPAFAALDTAVAGDISLSIDPFFYFERLCRVPEMPELRYDWHIDSILLETTPWISSRDTDGRKLRQRDESRTSYRSIERTDAWHDDEGNGHYILECTQIQVA